VPRRQLLAFSIGCWAAVATAVAHLAGHIAGPATPADEPGRQLRELAETYPIALPDGSSRSLMELFSGFSLTFVVCLALMGGIGLIVKRRCRDDATTMTAVARALAGAAATMVAISLTHWFMAPTLLLALTTAGFLVASATPPGPVPPARDA
jgi:hypothetical protein